MSRNFDMLTSSLYLVEINGVTTAEFTEVSGLRNENAVVEFQEGGENTYSHKFRGPNKYTNLVLKHGLTRLSPSIWQWREACIRGTKPPMVTVSVVMLDDKMEEFARWNFRNAWPVKWVGPSFKAGDDKIAIETLEIAYDAFSFFESPPQPPPPKPPEPKLAVRISPDTAATKEGRELTFTCQSYQGKPATSWQWKLDGQNVGDGKRAITHTFTEPGGFELTVDASNDDGDKANAKAKIDVEPGPFKVKIDPEESQATIGDEITFKSVLAEGHPAIKWHWDVAGTPKDGEEVSKTFKEAGRFSVKLSAENEFAQQAEATATVQVKKKASPSLDLSVIGPGARQDFSNWVYYHHAMFYFQLELKCVEKVKLAITGSGGPPPYITGYWKQKQRGSVAAKDGVFDAGSPGKIESASHDQKCFYCKTVGPHPSRQIYKAGSNNFDFGASESWVIAIYARCAGTWTLTATGIPPYPCTDEQPTVKDSVQWTMATHNRPGD